jgi:intraflagellar transport protein 46
MSRKGGKPDMEDEDPEMDSDRKDAADGDDDFDYADNNNSQDEDRPNAGKESKTKKIENQPFDEAVELSDGGSEIASDNGEQFEDEPKPRDDPGNDPPPRPAANKPQIQPTQPKPSGAKGAPLQKPEKKDDSDDDDDKEDGPKIAGMYNPAEYAHLAVNPEIQELFRYITRYKPITVDLDTKLKAFIPDYIPAVGEVDAFLKPSRPDAQQETLGLLSIDEPCLNQSKKSKLDLEIKELYKNKNADTTRVIHSIENAEKNPKEINAWINDVQDLHKKKQPPSVFYTKPFPEIETLMQEWPLEIEEALSQLKMPTEEVDMDLAQYCKLACALVDIPVHNTTNNKNVIESLHVFFTLYSEFRANPHFQQKIEQYDNNYH